MPLEYRNNILYLDNISLQTISNEVSTPCYIYSLSQLKASYQSFKDAFGDFPYQICYAVKANANLTLLKLLNEFGAGFDIVSGGELERLLYVGVDPTRIVFSGVGKSEQEITKALLCGIFSFHIESEAELKRIEKIAQTHRKIAPIALRVNPHIKANTHPYITTGSKETKFGLASEAALAAYYYAQYSPHLKIKGIACHIGSQIMEISPFLESADALLKLCEILKKENISLDYIDLGGGLGVNYQSEDSPDPKKYVISLIERLKGWDLKLFIEPGRALIANAGYLLTRVEYIKKTFAKNFAIVDAGMNDLLRPTLYQAYHGIQPVEIHENISDEIYEIVGPVCESGDFLAHERSLKLKGNDLLLFKGCGAYGFAMSSNYNTRPRAAEVLVDGDRFFLIRERESLEDLMHQEKNSLFLRT